MTRTPWLLALILAGCSGSSPETSKDVAATDSGTTPTTTTTTTEPPTGTTTPTGTAEGWCAVKQLFNGECVVCHSAASQLGGLDLETDPYAAIVGVAAAGYPGTTLVVPGDAAGSLLYRKSGGTQASDEGGSMPVGTTVSAAQLAALETWISAGATDECTGPTTPTTTSRYHAADYADPTVHGPAAKCQQETCTSCHGADLSGGTTGVSCDSCHDSDGDGAGDAGWRTDCVFCHGGTDNLTGAPPVGIDGATAGLPFDEHTAHVSETIHTAWDCAECHVKPVDVLSEGHVFVGDTTACKAEVDFTAGLSPKASWDGVMTCSNGYCHGTGLKDGSVDSGDKTSCDSCHADRHSGEAALVKQSGFHKEHVLDENVGCETCHQTVVDKNDAILAPSLHVNGTPDVAISALTWDPAKETCTGTCHGEYHGHRSW